MFDILSYLMGKKAAVGGGSAENIEDELIGYTPSGEIYLKPTQNIPCRGIIGKRRISKLTLDFSEGFAFTHQNQNSYALSFNEIPIIVIDGGQRGVYLYSYTFTDNSTKKFMIVAKGKLNKAKTNVFRQNTGLYLIDYTYTSGNGFGGNDFYSDTNFSTLIIRGEAVMPLEELSAFTSNTPFKNGNAGGTLYVPQALISDYEAATNWSTLLGYTNNQILPIEGSIYESKYADGTPIEV